MMKQLTCEMCGSHDLMKKDGVFVCQTCGCRYSPEEARKMLEVTGTVSIDRNREFDNILRMANNAYKSGHYGDAIKYINRIHEIDMNHAEAWRLKALSVCGMFREVFTEGMNYYDLILSWQNALMMVSEEEKVQMEDRIFTDFVIEFLSYFISYPKVISQSPSKANQIIMDRVLLMFKGLSEILRTPELEYFKKRIPDFKENYLDGLIEYYACFAFNIVKSVLAGNNALNNINRKYENTIWEDEFSEKYGLYLLQGLFDVAESNDTKAYVLELLAFSSLHYQFDNDEYELLEELDSNQKCKAYYTAMIQQSEKYQKKYNQLAEMLKKKKIDTTAQVAEIEKIVELIQQYNEQMQRSAQAITNEIQSKTNSFLSVLNKSEIEALHHKKDSLINAIEKNQEIMRALQEERSVLSESFHKNKALLRGSLKELSRYFPEADKLSRTIAEL